MIFYVLSQGKLETALAQTVKGRLSGEPQTPQTPINISPVIFHLQSRVEETFMKKELLCKIISISRNFH